MECPVPTYVFKAGVDIYKVAQPGWYVFDRNRVAILGPYSSRKACMDAVKGELEDRRRLVSGNDQDRTVPRTDC
jgi:hypothetical protein